MNEEATAHVGSQHQQKKNGKQNFAEYLSDYGHLFGSMKIIMGNLYIENKGILMDVLEKFYVFENTKLRNQINKCKSTPDFC
jgi:hypothetical protein